MRFNLADKENIAVTLDPQIGGLAGPRHEVPHDRPAALDDIGAPQEGRTQAECLRADEPFLTLGVDLHILASLQCRQNAIHGCRRLPEMIGKFGKGHPVMGGERLHHIKRPVERLYV